MDDLDRALALVAMMADPAMTLKNAADLKQIRKDRAENAKAFKDAKYASTENEKQLALIASQRDALKASKEGLVKREAALIDRKSALDLTVRTTNSVAKASNAELETREKLVSEREAWVKKHEKAIAAKKTSLAEMEVDIRGRGAQLATAVERAQAVG